MKPRRSSIERHRIAALTACGVFTALLLGGCASYGPGGLPAGATPEQAVAEMGTATGRYALPDGGQRLEFARGPMGKHTYMLDFDASGRLLKAEQVLNENSFLALRPGMTKDEVLQRIGHPSDERYLSRQQHRLWSYRYESPFCVWYQVSIDNTDRVAELGNNVDPMCDGADHSDR